MNYQTGKNKEKFSAAGIAMLLYYSLAFPSAVEYMIGVVFGILMIMNSGQFKLKVTKIYWLVIAFSTTYFGLQSFLEYSTARSIAYALSIILLFVFGYNWANNLVERYSESVLLAIRIIYIGTAAYIVLCFLYTFINGFSFLALRRDPLVFWNGTVGNSTHFGTLSAVVIALSCYGTLSEKGKWRHINIWILLLTMIANMLMANRISILFFCVFMLTAIVIDNKGKSLNKRLVVFITLLLLALTGYIIYELNLFDAHTLILRIPLFERANALSEAGYSDPRLERQLYVLQNFFKYTSGGGHYNAEVGEVHNVWLDIYDYAGWIPFVFFLIFTIYMIKQMWFSFKNKENDPVFGYLCILVGAFMLSFLEEPVFRSCEAFTVLFFFSCGLMNNYIKRYKSVIAQ